MDIEFPQSGNNLAVSKLSEQNTRKITSNEGLSTYGVKQESVKVNSINAETVDNKETILSSDKIKAAVEDLSDFAKASNRQLNFSVDENSDRPVVKVTDRESGEVIRQIPSEEILKLSERLRDLQSDLGTTVGILFNKQV